MYSNKADADNKSKSATTNIVMVGSTVGNGCWAAAAADEDEGEEAEADAAEEEGKVGICGRFKLARASAISFCTRSRGFMVRIFPQQSDVAVVT